MNVTFPNVTPAAVAEIQHNESAIRENVGARF